MREKGIDKRAKAQTKTCTQHTGNYVYTVYKQQCGHDGVLEKTKTRTFYFKNARQIVVRIQSPLCEVACEQYSPGLKSAIVKIYRTVVGLKRTEM